MMGFLRLQVFLRFASGRSGKRFMHPTTRGLVVLVWIAMCCSAGGADVSAVPDLNAVARISRAAFQRDHLKALLVRVDVAGKPVYMAAFGESMSGVPATTNMYFRNGAMAFAYLSTMLVELADLKRLRLDDRLSKYIPNLPRANAITLRNLANMTSGYADYVYAPEVLEAASRDPFHHWSSDELIRIGTSKPMMFAPGTNWGYSHTNYVILGRVLEKVTGMPLADAMKRYVFAPMNLTHTFGIDTPEMPTPTLHTFTSERREDLGIAPSLPFYEESTYWDPSWTTIAGAVQVTNLSDWTRSMELIGSGTLISRASFADALGPKLVGFGHAEPGCSACRRMTTAFNYGLGVVNVGPWTIQNKAFAGSDASVGYLRSGRIAISVVATYLPAAFDSKGNPAYATRKIFGLLVEAVAPSTMPAGVP